MRRTRYLMAYDIRDDRRLRQVHEIAKAYGYALQYSVFVCDLDAREKYQMRAELGETMDNRVDSVVFVDLGPPEDRGTECFEFIGQRDPLPPSGPVIL